MSKGTGSCAPARARQQAASRGQQASRPRRRRRCRARQESGCKAARKPRSIHRQDTSMHVRMVDQTLAPFGQTGGRGQVKIDEPYPRSCRASSTPADLELTRLRNLHPEATQKILARRSIASASGGSAVKLPFSLKQSNQRHLRPHLGETTLFSHNDNSFLPWMLGFDRLAPRRRAGPSHRLCPTSTIGTRSATTTTTTPTMHLTIL